MYIWISCILKLAFNYYKKYLNEINFPDLYREYLYFFIQIIFSDYLQDP